MIGCATSVNLLHCIITYQFGKVQWGARLKDFLKNKLKAPSFSITSLIKHAPIGLIMDGFYQKLQKESKSTSYPTAYLKQALAIIDQEGVVES